MRDIFEAMDARTQKQARYDRANTIGFYMKLNNQTDKDVIQWLWKQSSKQGAIKALIREAIAKESSGKQAGAEPLSSEPWNNGVGAPLCRESHLT